VFDVWDVLLAAFIAFFAGLYAGRKTAEEG
jgi:hypothetical protein